MPAPQDSNSPAPLDHRLHAMITQQMKLDIELATGAPGFKSEADVVRYCLEQTLPGLLASAERRYTGRTRLLVDTVDPETPAPRRTGERPPSMRRPGSMRPFGDRDVSAYAQMAADAARELAEQTDLEPEVLTPRRFPAVSVSREDLQPQTDIRDEIRAGILAAERAGTAPAGVTPWRDALEETLDEIPTRDQELGYVVSGDPFAPKSDVQ